MPIACTTRHAHSVTSTNANSIPPWSSRLSTNVSSWWQGWPMMIRLRCCVGGGYHEEVMPEGVATCGCWCLQRCSSAWQSRWIFAETRTVTFDDGVAGQPPKGFAFGLTKKEGAPGRWLIQQEGDASIPRPTRGRRYTPPFPRRRPGRCLGCRRGSQCAISGRSRNKSTEQLAWCGGIRTRTTTTLFEPTRWRTMSSSTRSRTGRDTDLALKGEGRPYGKSAAVPAGQWSTLRIVAAGPLFEVYYNGRQVVRSRGHDIRPAGARRRLGQRPTPSRTSTIPR